MTDKLEYLTEMRSKIQTNPANGTPRLRMQGTTQSYDIYDSETYGDLKDAKVAILGDPGYTLKVEDKFD